MKIRIFEKIKKIPRKYQYLILAFAIVLLLAFIFWYYFLLNIVFCSTKDISYEGSIPVYTDYEFPICTQYRLLKFIGSDSCASLGFKWDKICNNYGNGSVCDEICNGYGSECIEGCLIEEREIFEPIMPNRKNYIFWNDYNY